MKGFYKMGRVVVVTFDENEEEKLNELLHFLLKNTLRCLVNKIGYLITEH